MKYLTFISYAKPQIDELIFINKVDVVGAKKTVPFLHLLTSKYSLYAKKNADREEKNKCRSTFKYNRTP